MANLTITIDDDVLHQARRKALDQRTTVNTVLRRYLELYVGSDEEERSILRFVQRARASTAGSGSKGRRWNRDELYDRPVLRQR